jgi:hypothetical protein
MAASAAPFPDTPHGRAGRAKTAPKDAVIRRSLRRFTLGSGPLKRRSDRVQVIGRFVVAASLFLAPPLAVATASATSSHLQAATDAAAADRSRVRAVLLEDAPAIPHTSGDYSSYTDTHVRARAVWSLRDGTSREGDVLTAPLTPAGTAVPVWVDRAGHLTRAPLDRAAIPKSAVAVGLLPLFGMPLAAWTLYAALCVLLDARRERRWERDWAAVEPDWNSRLL